MNQGSFLHPGKLELFVGPMKSGKTRALIDRVDTLNFVKGCSFKFFKPRLDTRDPIITSRFGTLSVECTIIDENKPEQLLDHARGQQVIVIDEAQFFSTKLIDIIDELLDRGMNVLVAGLDTDFRGEPFGIIPALLAKADSVHKLVAVCEYPGCTSPATRSQRLMNGKSAPYDAPIILVGDDEEGYQPRCRKHHKVLRVQKA